MIGCLRTRVRMQPIIALYFEFETVLRVNNLGAWANPFNLSMPYGICRPYQLEKIQVQGLLGCKFQINLDFKSTFCKKTVQDLIRRRVMRSHCRSSTVPVSGA